VENCYLPLLLLEGQQTIKVAFDDGVAKEGMSESYSAENVCLSTSCPKEGMSESYMGCV
jgi:hypothetical protein